MIKILGWIKRIPSVKKRKNHVLILYNLKQLNFKIEKGLINKFLYRKKSGNSMQ